MAVQHRRSDTNAPPGTLPYLLLVDKVSKVPPEPITESNYEYLPDSVVPVMAVDPKPIFKNPVATLPAYSAGYRTGFGIFKVWLTVDEKEYTSMSAGNSCKGKLAFGAEEI